MKWIPTWYCNSIFDIDFEVLKNEGIKYIFTDLDNTLAPYNVPTPNNNVKEIIKTIKSMGFKVIIISNNTGKRVELFSKNLDIKFISGAKKPFTAVIKKYLEINNINLEECVLIGDQLMTDIKCAIKLNCKCVLTKPLSEEESIVTFLNRKLDKYYRKKYDLDNTCKKIDRRGV